MDRPDTPETDSLMETGGTIPGAFPGHAYAFRGASASAIPVLVAAPHAGRAYPESLLGRMRHPDHAALRLEDRYVDLVAERVAAGTGAQLLVAHAPRAMIDLNRAPDDIDWDMVERPHRGSEDSYSPGRRSRSGLGLIPRRLPGFGELWKRRHRQPELDQRIAGIHEPYHARLTQALDALRARWGAALLVDMHSMPPLARRAGQPAAEFVLGDRFGASCDGRIVARAFASLGEQGRLAAHNRPYAGGYVLERHARPLQGLHALQLEIDRSLYLDSRMNEPGEGFDSVVAVLVGVVRQLAAEVAEIGQGGRGRDIREAAE
jgi:N-formylglutamate amidohydrolase